VAYEPLPPSDYGVSLLRRIWELTEDLFMISVVVLFAYICLACCGDGSLVPLLVDHMEERRKQRSAFIAEGDGRTGGLEAAGVDMEAFSRRAEARARSGHGPLHNKL
jgi:hypothetical protein